MEMREVSSSQVSHIGHDPETSTMHVKFHRGGTYEYSNVTADECAALMNCSSIGSSLRAAVAGKPYKKIGG